MKSAPLILMMLLAACGTSDGDADEVVKSSDEATSDDPETSDRDETPDDGETSVDGGTPQDPADTPVDDPNEGVVTLDELYEPLFVASGCTAGYCHGTFGSEDAVAALVGVDAAQPVCGRTKFIVPGEPEQSILWLRARDTTAEDIECEVVKMPRDRTENLDAEITQMLHDWIAQGAKR